MRKLLVCAWLVLGCAAGPAAAQDAPTAYALTNGRIFDGIRDRIRDDVTVLVAAGRIERLAPARDRIPPEYEVIDLEGFWLMPGLFDVHTHLETIDQAERALESGVTTVRSASVPAYQDVGLQALVAAGQLAGPEVVATGVYVTPDLGDTVLADPRLAPLADGVESDADLRLLVRVNAGRGAGFIKTRGTERAGLPDTDPRQQVYSERQLRIIVEEAGRHDLPVMVHAHGDEGARAAVLAGARSIEHGTYLSDATLRLMKERGTWFVPTYVTMDEMNEERYDYVLRLRGRHMLPPLERAIRAAHRIGVRIATGADNYYTADSINRIAIEVEHFVTFGMSNFEALQTATVSSAELLRMGNRTGRIADGFEADLILLPANPLTDIRALQDVLMVMSNGRIAVKRIPFGLPAD
ncbi:MAG: amidohydrolase family protein [Woeseiaceae bacterium]|nr:amidohydrolase family protein [Woeseiaceae bacterium]